MINKDEILKRNQSWVEKKLNRDGNYFDKLAEGQSPGFVYIGCSDSRVVPELFMGLEPGEVFVHRNVANLFHENDLSAMTVLTYAIEVLKVKNLVVCGHYGCGGVQASIDDADFEWLGKIKSVYAKNKELVDSAASPVNKLVELNVLKQCSDLVEIDLVKNNKVNVHPWVFDITSGEIVDLSD